MQDSLPPELDPELRKRLLRQSRRGWPRDVARRHHIGVYALQVGKQWRVARATFYPAGWLRRRIERIYRNQWDRRGTKETLRWHLRRLDKELEDVRWASASAVGLDPESARESVRDAIGLLRLYSRRLAPLVNMDHQTFGLAPEVGHAVMHHFSISGDRIPLSGLSSVGIPPIGWQFTKAQIDAFFEEQEFVYLDRALRTPDAQRNDLQKRAATALRFLSLATAMLPEPVRVVLIATAFEELMADLPRENRRWIAARRAAYLTCGRQVGHPYEFGGSRPACLFLASKTRHDVNVRQRDVVRRGGDPFCSWYAGVLDLFAVRDTILHERNEILRRSAGANYEAQVDEALLCLASWAEISKATDMRELDDEIDRFVAAAYQAWPIPDSGPASSC